MPFTRKTQPAPVKPAPTPEVEVVTPAAPAVPKGPLDCPECSKPINHAGPHE